MPKPGVGKRHGRPGVRQGERKTGFAARPEADAAVREHRARELHDRVAQILATMLLDIERFKLEQTGRASVQRQFDLMQEWTRDALANVRDLVYDLRDDSLSGSDFPTLLRTGLLEPFAERTGIQVRIVVADEWPTQLPSATAFDLY